MLRHLRMLFVAFTVIFIATPAYSLTVVYDKLEMPGAPTVTINFDSRPSERVYYGPQHVTLLGTMKSFLQYCVSELKNQALSHGGLNQTMTLGTFADNGSGVPLTPYQISRVNWLVGNGLTTTDSVVQNISQLAIWVVENGHQSFSGLTAQQENTLNDLLTNGKTSSHALTFYRAGRDAQDSVALVPEPAAWALFIAGFGMVGWSMRRRNRAFVTA